LSIDRVGHQAGRGGRSGGLVTAKVHVFSARVFLDMYEEALINNIMSSSGRRVGVSSCHGGSLNHHGRNLDYHGGISSLPTQPPDNYP
jgi:hypothetical protein